MSFNNQQQAPAGDLLWEQERETGRWYTPYSDAAGNYEKWYYEDWYNYQVDIGAIRPEATPRSVAPPKSSTRNQKKKKPGSSVVTKGTSSRSHGSHTKEWSSNDSRGQGGEVYDDRAQYYTPTGYGQQNQGDGGYNREEDLNVAESVPTEEPGESSHTGGDQLASTVEKLTISSSDMGDQGQYSTSTTATSQWQQSTDASSSHIQYNTLPTTAGTYGYGGQSHVSWQTHGYDHAGISNPAQTYHRHVAGRGSATDGEYEELDTTYRQRSKDYKKFFRTGRVFSTLWTESYSDLTGNHNETFESQISIVRFGEKVHSKIRRFVVVVYTPEDKFCKCLPVTTYDGKGTEKRGINLKEHGQIYSSNTRPNKVRGIIKSPLKVNLSKGAKPLSPSFVNYGKAYTVETNVKVKDVGELDSASRKLLRQYWNDSMIVQVESEGENDAAGNQLLGVGAGLGAAGYTSTYAADHSASTSSAYDQQPSTTLYTYPTKSSITEQVSSAPEDTGYFSSSMATQYESSQAQEPNEQSTEHYSTYQPEASSSSAPYETQASSTSALPSSPRVESILDDKISLDKKGKRATWYLVSWVGDFDDSWVTDKDISQEWIDYYHNGKRERREGKMKVTDTEASSNFDNYVAEEEEDPLSGIHQAHADRSRRDSSGAASSRPEGRSRTNKDKNKGKKRTWF